MADELATEGQLTDGGSQQPAATPPANTGTSQATPPAQPASSTGPGQAGKTFTQEEVNRFLAEEKKKVRGQYADYEDLKAKAVKLTEIEQAQMTEAQKLQAQLEAAQKAIAQAEQQRLEAEAASKQERLYSKIISEAAKLNFEDAEDAYFRLRDSVKEVEEVAEAVKSLAEQKKYLIKKHSTPLSAFDPAAQGQPARDTDAQRRARIYGGGGSIFETGEAEKHGGGVVWPKGIKVE